MLSTYLATCLIDIAALLFLLGLLHTNNLLEEHRKKPFRLGILLTIVIILTELGTLASGSFHPGLRGLNILCNVIGFGLTPLVPVVLVAIFNLSFLKEHLYLLLPSLLNMVAVALSPSFGLIFSIDADNHYKRGVLFFVYVTIYFANLLFLFAGTLHLGKVYHYPMKRKAIILILFTITGTSIQLLFPTVYTSLNCVTFALVLYYLLLSEFDSSFDTLTGLYNRAAFDKAMKQLTNQMDFSIIVMDINNFKAINDTYGHEYGDTILKSVANIIKEVLDHDCTCYRIGGDEFYIVCTETTPKNLEYRMHSLTQALARERVYNALLPTVAYGYSLFERGKSYDVEKVLQEADRQMYHLKKHQKAHEQ